MDYVNQESRKFHVLASTEIMVLPSVVWRTGLRVLIQRAETGLSLFLLAFSAGTLLVLWIENFFLDYLGHCGNYYPTSYM